MSGESAALPRRESCQFEAASEQALLPVFDRLEGFFGASGLAVFFGADNLAIGQRPFFGAFFFAAGLAAGFIARFFSPFSLFSYFSPLQPHMIQFLAATPRLIATSYVDALETAFTKTVCETTSELAIMRNFTAWARYWLADSSIPAWDWQTEYTA